MTSSLAELPDRAPPADDDRKTPPPNGTDKGKEQVTDVSLGQPDGHGHPQHHHQQQQQQAHGHEQLNEQSPLLSPASGDDDDDGSIDGGRSAAKGGGGGDGDGDDHQKTKSVWYLILLTISIGGLQIAWSVEMSNGSPYLLSLGISKSLMALVWIAGPLSGTLVQPYVGMLSDNCRIRWGKRKPFMIGGAIATIISLMFLAWTREIVSGLLALFGADPESGLVRYSVIVTAVIWVYVLDFAINTGTRREGVRVRARARVC